MHPEEPDPADSLGGGLTTQEVIAAAEFRAALRRFLRSNERTARDVGLTPQRYLLLLMIKGTPDGSEESSVNELAERLQLAQSTVTELVMRAEDSGLVERRRSDEDLRYVHIRLTPEGERRLALAFTAIGTERRDLTNTVLHLGAVSYP